MNKNDLAFAFGVLMLAAIVACIGALYAKEGAALIGFAGTLAGGVFSRLLPTSRTDSRKDDPQPPISST